MALHDHELLSIWELAHRWCNLDPDNATPESLSPECRDLLRDLCLALDDHLNAFDVEGREILAKLIPLVNVILESKTLQAINRMHKTRTYNREILDSVFVSKDQVSKWCNIKYRPLPLFWYREDEQRYFLSCWKTDRSEDYPFPLGSRSVSPSTGAVASPPPAEKSVKLGQSRLDRQACQTAALALWKTRPNATIEELIKSKEIQQDNNGGLYKAKTLRVWLSEIDPRRPEQKRGRPKNNQ